jgi:Tol biopolymer transport system component
MAMASDVQTNQRCSAPVEAGSAVFERRVRSVRKACHTIGLVIWAALGVFAKDRLLLQRIGPSQSTLFIAKADGSDERPLLPKPSFDYNASFSSDGKWIVFTSERNGSADIYRVRLDGSNLERLTDAPAFDDQGCLSPDGTRLVFISTRSTKHAHIWLLDLKTKALKSLTAGSGSNFRPTWSPDGQWIAFSSDRNMSIQRTAGQFELLQAASVYVMRADGSALRKLSDASKFAGSPKWSPDGKRVIFYEMEIKDTYLARRLGRGVPIESQIASVDIATGARVEHTSGPGVKVSPQFLAAERIGYLLKTGPQAGLAMTSGEQCTPGQMRSPSWSPDGKWVVYHKWSYGGRRQNDSLFSLDPEFELAYSDPFPAFSHDGKKLAVSNRGTGPGSIPSISVMNPDGTDTKRIFNQEAGQALMPEWSPKDDWIVFGTGFYFFDRDKPARIMLLRPDGSQLREITKGPVNSGFASWSPDGKRLVYRVWGEPEHGLRIMDLEKGTSIQLTNGYDNFPCWSPKEDFIAFTSFREGNYNVYTIHADGTGSKRLTNTLGNDAHSVWSPDGTHLLFSSSRFGFKDEAPLSDDIPQPYGELMVMNADGSDQRPLTDNQWEDATPAWEPRFKTK